jgi:hypothetical protein
MARGKKNKVRPVSVLQVEPGDWASERHRALADRKHQAAPAQPERRVNLGRAGTETVQPLYLQQRLEVFEARTADQVSASVEGPSAAQTYSGGQPRALAPAG